MTSWLFIDCFKVLCISFSLNYTKDCFKNQTRHHRGTILADSSVPSYTINMQACRFCKEFLISNQLCHDIYVCMYLEYNWSFQSYILKNLLSSDYQIFLTPSSSSTKVGLFILPGNCFFTLIKQFLRTCELKNELLYKNANQAY